MNPEVQVIASCFPEEPEDSMAEISATISIMLPGSDESKLRKVAEMTERLLKGMWNSISPMAEGEISSFINDGQVNVFVKFRKMNGTSGPIEHELFVRGINAKLEQLKMLKLSDNSPANGHKAVHSN